MDNFRFKSIKNEYDGFYRGLLKDGKLPFWSTANGFFGSVISDEVYEAFNKIGLDKNRSFIDLGSGDGKAVLIAALFCNRSVGIEMDPALFKKSLEMQRKLNIPNAIFYNNDYYAHSISEFDVAFVYPDEPMHRGLEKKLMNELTGKLIHYGHHFHPQNLKAEDSFLINGSLFTIYSNK
jgi:SAM-dependent methyltransferase